MQVLAVEADGPYKGEGIVASAENAAGRLVSPVNIGHTCQETVAAVVADVRLSRIVIPVSTGLGITAISPVAVGVVEDGVQVP